MTTATVQPPLGCTLAGYAEAKRLPLELLAQLGLTEQAYLGRRAVRIPYLDPAGNQAAVRYRVALQKTPETGGAFRWQKGTKPIPYGLWRLDEGRRQGHVVLVEGESDTQTLWLHGVPALGNESPYLNFAHDWLERVIKEGDRTWELLRGMGRR